MESGALGGIDVYITRRGLNVSTEKCRDIERNCDGGRYAEDETDKERDDEGERNGGDRHERALHHRGCLEPEGAERRPSRLRAKQQGGAKRWRTSHASTICPGRDTGDDTMAGVRRLLYIK